MVDQRLLDILVCPQCKGELDYRPERTSWCVAPAGCATKSVTGSPSCWSTRPGRYNGIPSVCPLWARLHPGVVTVVLCLASADAMLRARRSRRWSRGPALWSAACSCSFRSAPGVGLGSALTARSGADALFLNPAGWRADARRVPRPQCETEFESSNAFGLAFRIRGAGVLGLAYRLVDYGESEATDRTGQSHRSR
jgi:uncharacterized protein YbaR (Trm112 family)